MRFFEVCSIWDEISAKTHQRIEPCVFLVVLTPLGVRPYRSEKNSVQFGCGGL